MAGSSNTTKATADYEAMRAKFIKENPEEWAMMKKANFLHTRIENALGFGSDLINTKELRAAFDDWLLYPHTPRLLIWLLPKGPGKSEQLRFKKLQDATQDIDIELYVADITCKRTGESVSSDGCGPRQYNLSSKKEAKELYREAKLDCYLAYGKKAEKMMVDVMRLRGLHNGLEYCYDDLSDSNSESDSEITSYREFSGGEPDLEEFTVEDFVEAKKGSLSKLLKHWSTVGYDNWDRHSVELDIDCEDKVIPAGFLDDPSLDREEDYDDMLDTLEHEFNLKGIVMWADPNIRDEKNFNLPPGIQPKSELKEAEDDLDKSAGKNAGRKQKEIFEPMATQDAKDGKPNKNEEGKAVKKNPVKEAATLRTATFRTATHDEERAKSNKNEDGIDMKRNSVKKGKAVTGRSTITATNINTAVVSKRTRVTRSKTRKVTEESTRVTRSKAGK